MEATVNHLLGLALIVALLAGSALIVMVTVFIWKNRKGL